MLKKLIVLTMILSCLASAALAESTHEHQWGEWVPQETGGHTAQCLEDEETLNVKHYTYSVNLGAFSASVCGICGLYPEGVFPLIEGAQAVSQKAKPSSQRGTFIVRGMPAPFSKAPEVVFAFTAAYTLNGALATWKDVSTVTIPVSTELAEGTKLIRIQPASGDDSIQNPEQHIEMEYVFENGAIQFTSKTPALYLLVKE